jgi:hypothetical protein
LLLDFLFYYDCSEDLGEFKAYALFLNTADAILGLNYVIGVYYLGEGAIIF